MPDTATKTAAPRRSRASTKSTPAAKPAPKTATPKAPAKAAVPAPTETEKIQITLGEAFEETKSYAKFNLKFDADGNETGMVGTMYVPLGTQTVKILLIGEEIEEAAE